MTMDALDTSSMSSREIDRAVGASVHGGSSIYTLDHRALSEAQPDLILTQELCEVCAVSYREVNVAARLIEAAPTVVSLEPRSLEEILSTVETVGDLTGTTDHAKLVVENARMRLDRVRAATEGRRAVPTVCIEWIDPIYDAGHWVPGQVAAAGGTELLGAPGEPSRRREWEDVLEARPEAMVVLACGLALGRARAEAAALTRRPRWADLPAVRSGRVWVADGPAFFNRPGPRAIRGVEVLAHLLHGVGAVTPAEAVRL